MKFHRITVNSGQMGGLPCIRGLRIPVVTVVTMIADGMTTEEILAAYPDLEAEDIREALHYAALANLPNFTSALDEGSVVVLDDTRVRIRSLPVGVR